LYIHVQSMAVLLYEDIFVSDDGLTSCILFSLYLYLLLLMLMLMLMLMFIFDVVVVVVDVDVAAAVI